MGYNNKVIEQLLRDKQYKTVVEQTTKWIDEEPDNYNPWMYRGTAYLLSKHYYPAVLNSTKALALKPDCFEALNNRGAAYMIMNMAPESMADLLRALELNPTSWQPHHQMGLIFGSNGQLDAAEYHFREAVRLSTPDIVFPHCSLGTLLLGRGCWEEGFVEDLHRPEMVHQPFVAPHWNGEDLNGKSILLFAEQGEGDRILSYRYINTIRDRYPDADITVKVQSSHVRLIKWSFPSVKITQNYDKTDYVCSLLNVPMVLKMTWDTVPRPERYLWVDPDVRDAWKLKLSKLPKRMNVGVCWVSTNSTAKSPPAAVLEELGTMPETNLISLQLPTQRCKADLKLYDWTHLINDWGDTAALVENLDMVITIDTSVCHLSGALGKKTSTLVKHSTYWPWMDDNIPPTKRYSIWYPSMTLFRQQMIADWSAPMRRLLLAAQFEACGLT